MNAQRLRELAERAADRWMAEEESDPEYIAAANPSAVLALLDRLDAAEAENDRLRAALRQARPILHYLSILAWVQNGGDTLGRDTDAALAAIDAAHGEGR